MTLETVKRRKDVSDAAIESKDQRWHCRNRVSLVFGSNDVEELSTYIYTPHGVEFKTLPFHQAKSKAIEEILDNCIDEFYRGHVTEIRTTLSPDKKMITVEDNGLGFPLDKVKNVYTEFRTGSKFRDEEVDENGFLFRTLGQNGLGASATCLTCDFFRVTVRHYLSGMEQTYLFEDGALKVKKTNPKKFKGHSGVRIEFQLAKEVYKNILVDEDLLRKRIIDLAYNNPGLTFYFNGERYLFKKGLYELGLLIDPQSVFHFGDEKFIYEGTNVKGVAYKGLIEISLTMTFDKSDESRERMISFVNSTPTYDGGFHHDKVRRLFVNAVKSKLERVGKREKVAFTDNDILCGLTFILGITMPNARFESQTKRKLVRDEHLEKAINDYVEKSMEKFFRKGKDYLDIVCDRAQNRQRFQELKDASKQARKQKRNRIEKLLDANERRDRSKCTLFICEGDSAIGGLRSARNKLYQGGIAIKGKPMNVAQATIKDILANQELSDIMGSIGLTIGEPPDFNSLRYSQIVFLADSDVDGGHINTLLTNFFFTFWPELFEQGCIQVAKAPLYEVITDKEKLYAESYDELEKLKADSSIKIKEIQRNKGLGEMSPEAFKDLLAREHFTSLTVDDAKSAKAILEVCFGKDSAPRKELLMESDQAAPIPLRD